MLFPVAWMLTVSVRPNVEVMKIPPDWIPALFTLEAYSRVLRSGRYLKTFANTYFVALAVTLLSLLIGAMAAYALARFRFRGQLASVAPPRARSEVTDDEPQPVVGNREQRLVPIAPEVLIEQPVSVAGLQFENRFQA